MPQQVRQQAIAHDAEITVGSQPRQIRQFKALKPARIDAGEWLEIDVDIQRHSMKAGSTPNPQADTRKLDIVDIHAGCVAAARGVNAVIGGEVDHALFESCDQVTNSKSGPAQVDQRIDH
jgi:hypothetical protein